jgi:hypothetical protein
MPDNLVFQSHVATPEISRYWQVKSWRDELHKEIMKGGGGVPITRQEVLDKLNHIMEAK